MSTVSHVAVLRLVAWGQATPVTARFRYDDGEPFEVRAEFWTGLAAEPLDWVFARSLLTDGMHGPAGAGDVRAWPSADHQHLVIELSSPYETARFEAPAAEIARFLDATYALVPDDADPPRDDIDDGIAAILNDSGLR